MKGRKQENFEDLMQKSKLHEKTLNLSKKEMPIKALKIKKKKLKLYLTLMIRKNVRKLYPN